MPLEFDNEDLLDAYDSATNRGEALDLRREVLRRLNSVKGFHRRAQEAESEMVKYEKRTIGMVKFLTDRVDLLAQEVGDYKRRYRDSVKACAQTQGKGFFARLFG